MPISAKVPPMAGFRLTPFLLFKINEHQLALEAAIIEPA
jgi:hypothetical protein